MLSTIAAAFGVPAQVPEGAAGQALVAEAAPALGMVFAATLAERLFCPEEYERYGASQAATLASLPKHSLLLDVGAFDGSNALAFAAAGHEVFAFEPSPSKAPVIQALFSASKDSARLKLFSMAVSDATGTLPFYVKTQAASRSEAIASGFDGSEQDQLSEPPWPAKKINVPVTTLDDAVREQLMEQRTRPPSPPLTKKTNAQSAPRALSPRNASPHCLP